jgi:hypothetical protein
MGMVDVRSGVDKKRDPNNRFFKLDEESEESNEEMEIEKTRIDSSEIHKDKQYNTIRPNHKFQAQPNQQGEVNIPDEGLTQDNTYQRKRRAKKEKNRDKVQVDLKNKSLTKYTIEDIDANARSVDLV